MTTEHLIEFSEEYLSAVKILRKRYRHIEDDIRPLIEQLRRGETPGDQIQGTVFDGVVYKVYKERLPNRDARRGKSGGYRAIYYLQTEDMTVMVTLYSKSDRPDIRLEEIRRIIQDVLAKQAENADDTPASDPDIPPEA